MSGKLLISCLRGSFGKIQAARMSNDFTAKIGNREVVGYGINGHATYIDDQTFPMAAVRYKSLTPDIQVLREKEKGDWKKLSIEEKKALYRASFCQTFSEMDAPTGEIKSIIGIVLMILTTGVWLFVGMRKFAYLPLPESFDEEHQLAQLDRMIKLDMNPITGLCKRT